MLRSFHTYLASLLCVLLITCSATAQKREYIIHHSLEQAKNAFSSINQQSESTENVVWYRSEFACFVYFFVLLFLLYLSSKFYSYRLKRKNEKLESLVSIRLKEIQNQKSEIENQLKSIEDISKKLQVSLDHNEEQKKELQDLLSTKDRFFSIISHDLRGPLGSLTAFSSLLINHIEHLSKEDIVQMAEELEKSVKNLGILIENLLTWSQSQTGDIQYNPSSLKLRGMVNEAIEVLENVAKRKNISLYNEVPDDFKVYADYNSVSSIIRNLVSNAIKFNNPHGYVKILAEDADENLKIMVKDNGVGMSTAVIDQLFNVGNKLSTSGTADERGSGLGLILSKEFVEANKGKIEIESVEGEGSTFIIYLPKHMEQVQYP